MSDSPDPLAQSVFARFVAERGEDDAVDFETWCARQPDVAASPELAARLAKLHAASNARLGALEAPQGRDLSTTHFRPRERARGAKPSESPEGALRPGQHIGPFVLQSFIAQGGMGQVWVALDEKLRRQIALKLVLPGRVDLRSVEFFAREARAGGRLAHPNIVTTLAHGSDGGLAWIAQELVEGSWTLKEFLDELRAADTVPKDHYSRVAEVVAQLADALEAAHAAGVIHRDVKPANVLIAPDDRPKLTDFGLARLSDESLLSMTGEVTGTYNYMSPEQVKGLGSAIDHRTDVFSLGIVLYELLTLRRPFDGDTTHQIAEKIINFDPPDAAKIRSQCPRDLAVICSKALEKDPVRRYQTMAEFAADLRRHLANEPIQAKPSGAWAHAIKWVKRHPVVSSSGAVAVIGFAVVAALLVLNVRTNEKLGQANTDLSEQTRQAETNAGLAEQRAAETAEQARIARENAEAAQQEAERAGRAERDAERKLADVLSLSATRNLERLVARAKELDPPHPDLVPRYDEWLREARELLDGRAEDPVTGAPARPSLADHRVKLAELQSRALPETDPARLEEAREHERFAELEALRAQMLWQRRMLGDEPWPDPAEVEAQLVSEKLPRISKNLNALAWAIVDPAAPEYGDELRALRLAELALEKAREADAAEVRDTLAWAQFRTGRLDEALATGTLAANGAADGSLDSSLAALRAAIAEWEPASHPARRDDLARLAGQETGLALAVGERRFADEDDAWWNVQLTSLVSGIEDLHDPATGLAGNTLNAAFGWGIAKREEFARTIRERSIDGPEAQRSWAEAIAAIKDSPKYSGLVLTPQLGLLPIGMDPDSRLWEFAHLQSGDVAERKDGKLVLTETTGIVLVLIPGGTFTMGAQSTDRSGPNYDLNAEADEGPPHAVTLSPHFISKYEMTQGQWLAATGTEPSNYRRNNLAPTLLHPVEQVSWTQCTATCANLGLVLPTEAQWERAARAGTSTPWCFGGPDREVLRGKINIADKTAKDAGATWTAIQDWPDHEDGGIVHRSVGSYPANDFGLHEVHGNLWEWCSDAYSGSAYQARDGAVDPQFAGDGSASRVSRGGSFLNAAVRARAALRGLNTPEVRDNLLGLRPARGITP
jgi:serine/threonine protein kinase/formylglycine-generating enzyme required for sulfatase activity